MSEVSRTPASKATQVEIYFFSQETHLKIKLSIDSVCTIKAIYCMLIFELHFDSDLGRVSSLSKKGLFTDHNLKWNFRSCEYFHADVRYYKDI